MSVRTQLLFGILEEDDAMVNRRPTQLLALPEVPPDLQRQAQHERRTSRTPSPEFEDDALGVVEVAREEELEARLVDKLGATIATCIRQSYKRSTDMALIS